MALRVKWKIRDQNSSFLICSVTFNRPFTFNELKCSQWECFLFHCYLLSVDQVPTRGQALQVMPEGRCGPCSHAACFL